MRRSAPRSLEPGRLAAFALVAILGGCKAREAAVSPSAGPVVRDDIADIEATLERNADDLEAEGIYVARASDPHAQPVRQQTPRDDAEQRNRSTSETLDVGGDEAPPNAAGSDRVEKGRTKSREEFWSRWLAKRGRKKNEAERCQRVCDLAESTCELADKICDLAHRHPDEVRYEELCKRAEHQCRVAAEACFACAG